MSPFNIGLLMTVVVLLAGSAVRWRTTPHWHTDFSMRRDTTFLMVAFLGSILLVMARERFVLNSRAFWLCNVALLPMIGAILFYLNSLIRAYRNQQAK